MSKAGKSQLVYLLRILEYCGKIQVVCNRNTTPTELLKTDKRVSTNL